MRTHKVSSTTANVVKPLNVSTARQSLLHEQKTLQAFGRAAIEVDEPAGGEAETEVRIDGCESSDAVKGIITVRASVGCNDHGERSAYCPQRQLQQRNPVGRVDADDPGSGYLYDELTFEAGGCN